MSTMRYAPIVCLVALCLMACGCGRNYSGQRRFALSGKVTVEEEMGATAGKYKVKINWNKSTGKKVKDAWGEEIMDETKEGLPAKYHADTALTADVSAKQTTFDFDTKTK